MKQELIWTTYGLTMKEAVVRLIQRIPYGMVVSYGELASQLDRQYAIHSSGWMVGRMLSSMERTPINPLTPLSSRGFPSVTGGRNPSCPRWRVINKQWVISALKLWQKGLDQIKLLESEGIQVVDGQVDMSIYEYSYLISVPSPVREGWPQRVF